MKKMGHDNSVAVSPSDSCTVLAGKRAGFTLVELLIIISILAIMGVILVGILDPIALVNRGGDARRKKDINRIKIALGEYMDDKGTFPTSTTSPSLSELNSQNSCGSDIFDPWLSPWPCDPGGDFYMITVDTDNSPPAWFKVLTKLKNENDDDIPEWWFDYALGSYTLRGGYSNAEVNFGVSSSNIVWHDYELDAYCLTTGNTGQCHRRESLGEVGTCQPSDDAGESCVDHPENCFLDNNCESRCMVSCCSWGQLCE